MKIILPKSTVTTEGFQIPATIELVHAVDPRYEKKEDPSYARTDRAATFCGRTVQISRFAGKENLMDVVEGIRSELTGGLCLQAARSPVKG